MYELGYRTRNRHFKLFGLLVCLVILIGCVVAYRALHLTAAPRSQIKNGSSKTTYYQPSVKQQVHIDKPLFSVSLPAGWSEVINPAEKLSQGGDDFRSSSADARQMAIYIDNIPATLAINRALIVSSKGATLNYGTVSDNCVTFTRPNKSEPGSGQATGLWQGANFICDLGNYERDVVGTVSTDGQNYVNMQGPNTGRHQVFITYTDNGPSPDFGVFYGILDSFTLK